MLNLILSILLFPLRLVVFLVGFIAYWMEILADWLVGARGKTEYVREGSCKRCGKCCRLLALILPKGVSKRDWVVRIVSMWHRLAMNFTLAGEEDGWLVYRCNYYKEKEGSDGYCSIYPFRHRICRFFPRQKLYAHPSVHRDCGFKFVRRDIHEKRENLIKSGKASFDGVLNEKMEKERSISE